MGYSYSHNYWHKKISKVYFFQNNFIVYIPKNVLILSVQLNEF